MNNTFDRLRRIIQGRWQRDDYNDRYVCEYYHPKARLRYEVRRYDENDEWRARVRWSTYRTETELHDQKPGRSGKLSGDTPTEALGVAIEHYGDEIAETLGTIDPAGLRRICEEEGFQLNVTRQIGGGTDD